MSATELLHLARGPLLDIAIAIFVLGLAVRLLEIFMLGRKPDLSEPRDGQWLHGLKTIVLRSRLTPEGSREIPTALVLGYIFHIGFFVVLLLFVPHIELFRASLGVSWPGLPTLVIDATTVVTLIAMLAVLGHRLLDPVKRFLARFEDYLVWLVTFLPLLSGYVAFHRMFGPYALVLALHILTVELFLVVFPFTKLIHAVTVFAARWYNGAIAGRRGVQS